MITQPEKIKAKAQKQAIINTIQPLNKQQRLKRCQYIVKLAQQKIQVQIKNGQTKLRNDPLHIQSNQPMHSPYENPQISIRDKISSLNNDLESLQKHIMLQKQQQRIEHENKKKQASILIQRLKKQKQQHKNKLKMSQMANRLKNSAFSQDILKIMRQRRDQIIKDKKKDLQDRIQKNINRKIQRQDSNVKNQVHYWSKVKQMQQRKKRHHSTKILPSINRFNEEQQFGVNLQTIERKNSLNNQFQHKRNLSNQDISANYQNIVNRFLQRAKAKQTQSKSQNSININIKSRVATHEFGSDKNDFIIQNSRVTPLRNQKIQKIISSYNQNKHKLLGNEYLKQSLLVAKNIKSSRVNTIQDSSLIQQSLQKLQMKGNPAIFSRNDKIANLQQRRQKILHNLLSQKIDKTKAVQMLTVVQSKLDRIDPQGIQNRLKKKLQVFQQYQNKNKNRLQTNIRPQLINEQEQKQQAAIENISHNQFLQQK